MISIDWKKERIVLLCDHCGREITDADAGAVLTSMTLDGAQDRMVGVYCKGRCLGQASEGVELQANWELDVFLSMMRNTMKFDSRVKEGDAKRRLLSMISF